LSEFPYVEEVETFCSKKRRQVLISLRMSQEPKGVVISGVPESCNYEATCSKGALCLLKAKQITTGRKRR
jgi:putative component of membrane protein insertase Oxa1/YidC/SpoIIIJ protein YidD